MQNAKKTKMDGAVIAYRVLLLALGILGVTLQVLDDGPGMFMYYTILSNVVVCLALFYMIAKHGRLGDFDLRMKDGVAMSILITMVVYHIMLAPTAAPKDYYNIENYICHYILPLGYLLDSLFLDRVTFRKADPFLWSLLPVAYFGFALVNGFFLQIPIPGRKNFYPYFFVDVEKLGLPRVLLFCLVILTAYIATGYLYMAIKALIHKKIKKNSSYSAG